MIHQDTYLIGNPPPNTIGNPPAPVTLLLRRIYRLLPRRSATEWSAYPLRVLKRSRGPACPGFSRCRIIADQGSTSQNLVDWHPGSHGIILLIE